MQFYKDRLSLARKHIRKRKKSTEGEGERVLGKREMGAISCEQQSCVSSRDQIQDEEIGQTHYQTDMDEVFCPEAEDIWPKVSQTNTNTISNSAFKDGSKNNRTSGLARSKKKNNQVLLEGYVEVTSESNGEDDLMRTKSLTDEDLDELKGCVDLGFGFGYDEIPELCNTLPALELCYSMSQKFLDEHHHNSPERASPAALPEASSGLVANWKISNPGDDPEDVKARLKFWAQAVACTVRLCS